MEPNRIIVVSILRNWPTHKNGIAFNQEFNGSIRPWYTTHVYKYADIDTGAGGTLFRVDF